MTVIHLATARARLRSKAAERWRAGEQAELMRLYSAMRANGEAVACAFGQTENRDPQFYVLSDDGDRPCTTCVSRLSRGTHVWYIVEDGSGGLVAEGSTLRSLVNRLRGCWHRMRTNLLLAPLMLLGAHSAAEAPLDEFVASAFGSLMAIG